MRHRRRNDSSNPGQDSFLDIVANIVGILVILVMVAGVRAKSLPPIQPEVEAANQAAVEELRVAQQRTLSLAGDITETRSRVAKIRHESLLRFKERERLALMAAAIENDVEKRRQQLDGTTRLDFDLDQQKSEVQAELFEVEIQRRNVAAIDGQTLQVESLPTPLSKAVDDQEYQFQLLGGRIAPIPMERFLQEFQHKASGLASRMGNQPEVGGTIGPYDGFRMTFVLGRVRLDREEAIAMRSRQDTIRLKLAQFIPESRALGEPIDVALAEGSAFRRSLAGLDPRRASITIWTYEDSFEEFRRLKKILHAQGFATAGRPMPLGEYIGASPSGSKSRAE